MDIRIKDASAKELKELMETFASLGGAPTQQQQLPQQNLHQSVEIQKIQHDIGQLAQVMDRLVTAQVSQMEQPPRRTHIHYSQPQISPGPTFPSLAPAAIPAGTPRYQTQPMLPTDIQEQVDAVPGYVLPAWVDKIGPWAISIAVGGLAAYLLLPWIRSLAPTVGPPKVSGVKAVPNSANLLKVPNADPPTSPSKQPPPPGVLDLNKLLPAVK